MIGPPADGVAAVRDPLGSWRDGATKSAIIDFVAKVGGEDGSTGLRAEDRVAVFDNDGTLWCEKPMPIQLDFILRRLHEMAEGQPALRDRQPWKAAFDQDYGWLASVLAAHYAGDDTELGTLEAGVLAAHGGLSVEEFERLAGDFLDVAQHPSLGRRYIETAYLPMIELLDLLRSSGFANYIVSGGGRDFMRPISQPVYAIPRERVIGSSTTLSYDDDGPGGTIRRKPETDYLDDGAEKPVRIWSRTGRRPVLAAGNSNGDIPMLRFAHHQDNPTLRLLILHDDEAREFAYTAGAEAALDRAAADGWTIVSMKDDWLAVF